MRSWFDKSRSPIGLDLGSHSIKLVQLRRGSNDGGPWSIESAVAMPLPADLPDHGAARIDVIAPMLEQALKQGAFSTQEVVMALPSVDLKYKSLRLPEMNVSELDDAVRREAIDRLGLTEGKYDIQYFDAGKVRQGDDNRQEVIVLAAAIATIKHHLDLLTKCGLHAIAIDVSPSAIFRALVIPSEHTPPPTHIMIDVGHSGTNVVIARGNQIVFFRTIPIGGQQLDRAVAEHLHLSWATASQLRASQRVLTDQPADVPAGGGSATDSDTDHRQQQAVASAVTPSLTDLGREIGLCLRYFSVTFRGQRPESARLVGGEAACPLAKSVISQGAGIDFEPVTQLPTIDQESCQAKFPDGTVPAQWVTAIGLAMRHLTQKHSTRARSAKRGATRELSTQEAAA